MRRLRFSVYGDFVCVSLCTAFDPVGVYGTGRGVDGSAARLEDAFAACGVDPAFYAQRAYGKDEVLPWSTIDVGVKTSFLWNEREQAYAGRITPDCRMQCSGCGANKLEGGVVCDA